MILSELLQVLYKNIFMQYYQLQLCIQLIIMESLNAFLNYFHQ